MTTTPDVEPLLRNLGPVVPGSVLHLTGIMLLDEDERTYLLDELRDELVRVAGHDRFVVLTGIEGCAILDRGQAIAMIEGVQP